MNKILSKIKNILRSSKGLPAGRQGFTLIELLIVIAILGILATAVLSAINPVEQINRSRDTGTQSDAEQLLSAIQRFNASQGYYPWQTGPFDPSDSDTDPVTGWTRVANDVASPDGWTVADAGTVPAENPAVAGNNVLDILGSSEANATNELLEAYVNRITADNYNSLYTYNDGENGSSTYVCFLPQSQQFEKAAADRCGEIDGPLPDDYPTEACDDADNLFLCLP